MKEVEFDEYDVTNGCHFKVKLSCGSVRPSGEQLQSLCSERKV